MRYRISPLRHAADLVLDVFGVGPRRSALTPARHPETRLRFAQYVSRTQPNADPDVLRRTVRLLGNGGAVSRGVIRHARSDSSVTPPPEPRFRMHAQPSSIVALRRARAGQEPNLVPNLVKSLLHALHVR